MAEPIIEVFALSVELKGVSNSLHMTGSGLDLHTDEPAGRKPVTIDALNMRVDSHIDDGLLSKYPTKISLNDPSDLRNAESFSGVVSGACH